MPSGHSCQQKPISWQFVYTYRIVKKWTDLICQRRQDAEVSSTEHNSNWRSWLLRLTTASSVVRPHTRLYSRVLVVHSSLTHIYLPIWTLSALSTHAVNIVPHTNIPVYWPFSRESGTTRVSRYQKGTTNLDFTETRDSEWQWHQLGYMQVCTSLQTDNHASTPPLGFLQAGCHSCRPTNSVKALKGYNNAYCTSFCENTVRQRGTFL